MCCPAAFPFDGASNAAHAGAPSGVYEADPAAAAGCGAWQVAGSVLPKGDQFVWEELPVGALPFELLIPNGSTAAEGAVRDTGGDAAGTGVGSISEGVLDVVLVAGEICTALYCEHQNCAKCHDTAAFETLVMVLLGSYAPETGYSHASGTGHTRTISQVCQDLSLDRLGYLTCWHIVSIKTHGTTFC